MHVGLLLCETVADFDVEARLFCFNEIDHWISDLTLLLKLSLEFKTKDNVYSVTRPQKAFLHLNKFTYYLTVENTEHFSRGLTVFIFHTCVGWGVIMLVMMK